MQTVQLERPYENPVIFAQSASHNGADPVVVRVDNVQSDQFDIYLAEPSDENGLHEGVTVSYVVLEKGLHHLIDGTRLKVGTVETSATVGKQITNKWKSVSFDTDFEAIPEVFSQIQSATTGKDSYLHTRQKDRPP